MNSSLSSSFLEMVKKGAKYSKRDGGFHLPLEFPKLFNNFSFEFSESFLNIFKGKTYKDRWIEVCEFTWKGVVIYGNWRYSNNRNVTPPQESFLNSHCRV